MRPVAPTFHQLSGKPTGGNTDKDEPQQIHIACFLFEPHENASRRDSSEQLWPKWTACAISANVEALGIYGQAGHRFAVHPRPINGILVAITVMNCTLASSGRFAI